MMKKLIPLFFFSVLLFACTSRTEKLNEVTTISENAAGQIEMHVKNISFKTVIADSLNNAGLIKMKASDYKAAIDKFSIALSNEPDNPTILSNLGMTYYLMGDPGLAEKYLMDALNISDSTHMMAASNLGLVYQQTKKFQKAIDISKVVLRTTNEKQYRGPALINIAASYLNLNACDSALYYIPLVTKEYEKVEAMENQLNQFYFEYRKRCSKK